MHRDVRPAKILVNLLGAIKLCGFGNSRQLIGSVADTYTGSHCYMAPERIVGESYTVKADVWSAGLTLMELAVGVFPIFNESPGDVGGILDLYKQIVNEPSPKLPQSDAFPTVLENMIDNCLAKDPTERKSPQELYVWECLQHSVVFADLLQDNDPFILASKRTPVDLKAWALSVKR
jgi:mitogen-activated protein kinase kinase